MFAREVIGPAVVYCGDSRDVLCDVPRYTSIVTDPPYGIEDMVGGYGRSGKTIANDKDLSVCSQVINMAWDRHDDLWMASFYSSRITPKFMLEMPSAHYVGEVVWDKCAPGMGAGIRYQHENVALFKKGDVKPVDTIFSTIRYMRLADEHPHQKPVEVMMTLCKLVGGTVLDPFMGSGSTGVACLRLGIPFIGIELTEEYFQKSCERLYAEHSKPDMFAEVSEQVGLF